jgi:hypothetical protein
MSISTGIKALAGAVALAVSGGAFAQTTTQSIILNIVDTTNGNAFVFDTSLPTSASNPGNYSTNLGTLAAYQQFIGAETSSSDVLEFSVVGYNLSNTVDTTSVATPTVVAGQKSSGAATVVSQFLSQVANPSGGATYLPESTTPVAAQWATSDLAFSGDIGGTDLNVVGSSEQFYAITTTSASGSRNGASVAQLASSWTLSSTGLLSYGSPAPVPLPAPVWLLMSGLGLMVVVARRRQPASALPASFA